MTSLTVVVSAIVHLLPGDDLSLRDRPPGSTRCRRCGSSNADVPRESSRGLNKIYRPAAARLHVLRDVDLDVRRGEMVAIVGASGVGKSTLLHLLGGLDRADSGSIHVGDTDLLSLADPALVAFRNRHVGFVFQFHHLLPEFDAVGERRDADADCADAARRGAAPVDRAADTGRPGRAARPSAEHAVGR